MNNNKLALIADTDIASTVSAGGATRSFAEGGLVTKRKSTKKEASYVDGPVTKEPCRACTMFKAPSSCTAVMGVISPEGHCKYYEAKKGAAEKAGKGLDREVVFVRHGSTSLNDAKGGDRIRGWRDVPLDAKGMAEAKAIADKLKNSGIDCVYYSPLQRAKVTAKAIAKATGAKTIAVPELKPWNLGKYTGQVSKDAHPIIKEHVCSEPNETIPEGESFNDFKKRAFIGIGKSLDERFEKPCIVSHHRVERLIAAWVKAGQPANHDIDTSIMLQHGLPPGQADTFTLNRAHVGKPVRGYAEGGIVEGGDDEEDKDEEAPDFGGNEDSDLAVLKELPEAPEKPAKKPLEQPEDLSEWRLSTPDEVKNAKYEDENEWRLSTPEEVESLVGRKAQLQTFGEHAAQGVIPLAASLYPMAVGAELGSVAGPIGSLIGGAIGGGVAAFGARSLQDYITEKLGWVDKEAQEARSEANPISAIAGELAPAAGVFKVGPLAGSLKTRLGSAAALGAIDVGQQVATGQDLDPTQFALAVAQGGIFPQLNKFGERLAGIRQPSGNLPVPKGTGFETQGGPYDTGGPPEGSPGSYASSWAGGQPKLQGDVTSPFASEDIDRGASATGNSDMPPSGGPGMFSANDNAGGLQTQPGRPDLKPERLNMQPNQPANDNMLPKTDGSIAADKQVAKQSEPLKTSRGQAPVQPPPVEAPDPQSSYSAQRDRMIPGNEQGRGYYKLLAKPTETVANVDENGIASDIKGALTGQPIQEVTAYHGTNEDFDKFDLGKAKNQKYENALFFTSTREGAQDYGKNVREAKLVGRGLAVNYEDAFNEFADKGDPVTSLINKAKREGYDYVELTTGKNDPKTYMVVNPDIIKEQREAPIDLAAARQKAIEAQHKGEIWNGEYWETPEEHERSIEEEENRRRDEVYPSNEELFGDESRAIANEQLPKNVERINFASAGARRRNRPTPQVDEEGRRTGISLLPGEKAYPFGKGHAIVARYGDDIHVQNIDAGGAENNVKALRELHAKILADFPGVKSISGRRVSGARAEKSKEEQQTSVPIHPALEKRAKDLTAAPKGKDVKEPPKLTGKVLEDVSRPRGEYWKQAIERLRDLRDQNPENKEYPVWLHEMETTGDEDLARRYLEAEKAPERVAGPVNRPVNAEGKQVSKKATQARANTFIEAAQNTIDKFHKAFPQRYVPRTTEERHAYAESIRQHLDEYNNSLPTEKSVRPEIEKYVRSRPRFKGKEDVIRAEIEKRVQEAIKPFKNQQRTPGQSWIAAARQLSNAKTPHLSSILKFVSDTDLLRTKEGAKLVREEARDEANIARNKRQAAYNENLASGDEAPEEHFSLNDKLEEDEFSIHDPETHEAMKSDPLEAEDLHRWQEEHTFADNLNHEEYEVMREATTEPLQREGQPGQTAHGYAEESAKELREKSATLKALREAARAKKEENRIIEKAVKAAEPPKSTEARDESQSLPDNKLGEFWNDERGSLDIDKIRDAFVASKDAVQKWYDEAIGKYVTPARSGKLGSHTRKLGHYSESILAQAMSLANRSSLLYSRLLDAHYKQFTKMSLPENQEFLDRFENKTPQKNPFLQATDSFFRKVLGDQFKLEESFNSAAEWRDNYLPHIFKNKGDFEKFDRYMQNKYGPTWFQNERMFNTFAEARAAGYELKSNNPAELVSQRLMAGVSMVSKMWALHKLNDMGLAHPIKEAPHSVKGNPDWMVINAPDRHQWIIAPEAKQMWKNAMDRDALWQGDHLLGSAFRTWMQAKAIWVPLKLSLSGFHLLHTAHIHMNAGLADGWMFNGEKHNVTGLPTNPIAAAKSFKSGLLGGAKNLGQVFAYPVGAANRSFVEPMLKRADAWAKAHGSNAFEPMFKASENFSKQFHGLRVLDAFNNPDIAKTLTPEGQQWVNVLHEMGMSLNPGADYDIKSAQAFQQALGQGGLTAAKGAGAHIPELIQKLNPLQHFLFGTLIPMWKASQAFHSASALMRQHPELVHNEQLRRVALRKLGKNLDERYGEVFYPAQLWGKMFKNIGQASFLSMGWNVGFANTLAGALTDNVRSAGTLLNMLPKRSVTEQAIHDSSNKLSYVASYAATSALLTGALSYYLSGSEPKGLDYVFPRAGGENPDGSPRRYTTMSFNREPVMFTKHSEAEGGPIGGAMKMLWSKMVFAPFVQAASNRDFFNREMSDPDASYFTQLGQRALGMSKDLLNPISFESAKQAERSGGTARDKYMSYAGFGPAAAYISKKDIQNKIAHDYYEGPGAKVKPYEDRETAEKRIDLRAARQRAIRAGDDEGAEKAVQGLIDTGLKAKSVGKEQYGNQDVYQFKQLEPAKKVALVKHMDEDDFKKYVINSMSKRDKSRAENDLDPLDRTHARMLAEWKRLGHTLPEM